MRAVPPRWGDEDWECVALRGVRLQLRVGVHAGERQQPQPVEVEVELYRRRPPGERRGLADCLDYDRLYHHLTREWPQRPHTELLEQLAEELVAFCLADPRVEACRVVVRKPAIYAGRAVPEVVLYRQRALR